jgi:acyl carrier protein
VEAALRGCKAVRDAAALVLEDEHGDKCLAACVVPASRAVSVAGLREHLSTVLPEYMVPTAWAFLEALPLNPNGKIDRRVLESSAFDLRPQSSADHDASEIERKLLKTWSQVLGRSQIGIHDNFLEVGGHSLNVVRLRARIFQDFGVSLSLESLLKNQTVSAQAAMLLDIGADEDNSNDTNDTNDTNDVAGLLALTPAQERFLATTPAEFLDTNTLDFLFKCKRERRDVVAAIRRVISRHAAFRISGFLNEEGAWRQVVSSKPAAAIREFEDVRTLEPFIDMCRATGKEISLTNSVFYTWCVCSGPGSTFVYFTCHHLIADAISLAAIKLELDLLLSNGAGIEPPVPSSIERWIDEHSSPKAMAEYYQELSVWERHTSRSRDGGGTLPAKQGTPARNPVTHSHVIPVSHSQIDHIHILAAVIQAFSQPFQAETVQCRVVDSGRGVSHSLDDATTVGWLAHHIPLSIPVRASLRQTAANTRAEIAGLARRGLGYGWLRYKEKVPALCSALQLTELPLYFNHLYADSERYSTFTDITHLLPRDRKVDSEPFRGFAVQVLQSDRTLDFTVSFDGEHIRLAEVETFINALDTALEELVSEVH